MKRDTKSYLRDLSNKRTLQSSIYAQNVGAAKYLNQLISKVKKYVDNNTLILGDFNLALSTLDRSLRTTFPKKEEL